MITRNVKYKLIASLEQGYIPLCNTSNKTIYFNCRLLRYLLISNKKSLYLNIREKLKWCLYSWIALKYNIWCVIKVIKFVTDLISLWINLPEKPEVAICVTDNKKVVSCWSVYCWYHWRHWVITVIPNAWKNNIPELKQFIISKHYVLKFYLDV